MAELPKEFYLVWFGLFLLAEKIKIEKEVMVKKRSNES
jgi:hypothetical protein